MWRLSLKSGSTAGTQTTDFAPSGQEEGIRTAMTLEMGSLYAITFTHIPSQVRAAGNWGIRIIPIISYDQIPSCSLYHQSGTHPACILHLYVRTILDDAE
jgi:hypothetical protein